jgi:TonB family protein
MNDWGRLLACAAFSIAGHFALTEGLEQLPPHKTDVPPEKISIRVIAPPAEPPPEPPKPAAIEPTPTPAPTIVPPTKVAQVASHPKPHVDQPPTPPSVSKEAPGPRGVGSGTGDPHFGVSMESTSQGGGGPAMQVGNTTAPQGGDTAEVTHEKPRGGGGGGPVPDYQATKRPLPQGRCTGTYTDDARKAGVEGTVELDVTIGADGRTSDIAVVHRLAHGLTDAAIAALRGCRFTPGEVDGKPVAVRIHGFKISFYLQDSD